MPALTIEELQATLSEFDFSWESPDLRTLTQAIAPRGLDVAAAEQLARAIAAGGVYVWCVAIEWAEGRPYNLDDARRGLPPVNDEPVGDDPLIALLRIGEAKRVRLLRLARPADAAWRRA